MARRRTLSPIAVQGPRRPRARDARRTGGPSMNASTLAILRRPYCGGRLELVTSLYNRRHGDEIYDGVLGCHCCIFPVIAGIPVMLLEASSRAAVKHLEAGRPDFAQRAIFEIDDDDRAARFE